ncbi:TRAM domain protein [Leptospira broomii serovar Hurstbridge str. 5399]|uniref:TRAM domain protein n=1 Tax=Leptospira broomii serovar Hurstbridge str. 5399 TaxID=1049789 RepID=T0F7Z4_9LEPT|nr:TRAM domain-containing protein [Leptospira broomii]EQA44021.1 TRAM domain protein [Leptospira broomii serovar Hurstbridge str. 5399]
MSAEKNRSKGLKKSARNSETRRKEIFLSREVSDIAVEKWANLGTAIAHLDGKTVFVKAGIPGEFVKIKIEKETSSLIWGTVISVSRAAQSRISSDCASFPECGGCSYRHISYDDELKIKEELLLETLDGIGKLDRSRIPELKVLSGPSEAYRNTAQIKLQKSGQSLIAGFFKENSNTLVKFPTDGCKHLPNEMNEYIKNSLEKKIVKNRIKEFELRFSSGEVIEYKEEAVDIGPYLEERIRWKIPPGGFTQVNRFLIEPWLQMIRSWIPEKSGAILELYCGAGLISLSISSKIEKLFGFELSNSSVLSARENAKRSGKLNLEFQTLNLERNFPSSEVASQAAIWILNPPRSGASKKVLHSIEEYKPPTLIYSSCNHTTLARDLRELTLIGYRIRNIALVDFFPRTQHFEILVQTIL